MKKQILSMWKMTRRTMLACLLLLACWNPATAQTTLAAGDVLCTGFNVSAGATKTLQFVLMRNVTSGTVFKFGNNSFLSASSSGAANNCVTAGGVCKWTAGAAYAAGTVINYSITTGGTPSADIGTAANVSGGGTTGGTYSNSTTAGKVFVYYSPSGDGTGSGQDYSASSGTVTFKGTAVSLLAYQGSSSGYTTFLPSGSASTRTTYCPSDMTTGDTVFLAGNAIGGYYSGTRSFSSVSAMRTAILNRANWSTVSSGSATIPTSSFTLGTTPSFTGATTITVCQSSSANSINSNLTITDAASAGTVTETWSITSGPTNGSLSGFSYAASNTGGSQTPSGLTYTPTSGYTGTDAFTVQVSNGSATASQTVNVTVAAGPNPGTVTPVTLDSLCATAAVQYQTTGSGGVWSSSNTSIATVDPSSGVITGIYSGSTMPLGGTATISYTASTVSCGTTSATRAVYIRPFSDTGTLSPAAGTILCTGATRTYSSTSVTNGLPRYGGVHYGHTWTTSNSSIASVESSTGIVHGIAAGTVNITYTTAPNGCGSFFAKRSVVVQVTPTAGTISGTTTMCVGASNTLTSSGTAGGAWTTSNSGIASVNSATGSVTGVSAGSATITYTASSVNCGTQSVTTGVTINAAPSAGTVSGTSPLCTGATATYTSSGVGGGTWSSSASGVATVSATGVVYGVSAGSANITYSVSNACGSNTAFQAVTVNTSPSAGTVTGTTPLCTGASATYTSSGAGGGSWSSSASGVATVSTSGSVTGVSAGSATITYTVSNTCGTSTATQGVTINAAPSAGTVSGTTPLCTGASATYTSTGAGGGSWSSSASGVATVSATGSVTGVSAGSATITYTVSNTCGTSTATQAVTVNASPSAGTVSGTSPLCVGASATYTSSGTGGGSWSSSASGVATVSTGGSVTGVSAGSATITYTVSNTCGTNTATQAVTVNPLPDAGTVSGTTPLCVGASATYTSTGTGGGSWSSSASGVATVSATGSVTGVSAGSATITYTVSNTCGTNTATQGVTINPLPNAGTVSGTTPLCVGASATYTSSGTGGGSWSSSASGVATVSATGSVTGVSAGSATITYTVSNTCGTNTATQGVTINPLPVAGTISGATSVCTGANTTLTTTGSGGTWSSTNSGVATVSTGGVVTGVSAGSATISYTASNTCGTVAATSAMTVNTSASAGTISGATSVCQAANTTLTTTGTGGTWSSSATGVASVSTSGVVYGVSAGSATISYVVTGACGAGTATSAMTVNPLPSAGTVSGTSPLCVGASATYTSTGTGGTWSSASPGVATVSTGGSVTGVSAGSATISYTVSNTCGTVASTQSVTVNPLPNAGTVSGATSVCAGSNTTLTSSGTGGGTWSSSATGVASVSTSGVVYGVSAGSATISYSVSNTCGTDVAIQSMTVNPLPNAGTISGVAIMCATGAVTMTTTGTGGTWSSSNTSIATAASSGNVYGLSGGSVTISYTVSNTCGTDYATHALTVNPLPDAGTISGSTSVCVSANTTLTTSGSGGTWSTTDATVASVSTSGVVHGVAAGSATISYYVSTGCGTSLATQSMTVNPLPNAGTISGATTVCVSANTTLTTSGTGGGTWSSGSPGVATVTTSGVVYGVSPSTATISYTVSNTCGTDYATSAMTVNALPNAGTISGAGTVCQVANTTLTSSGTGGGTWTSSASSVASVSTTGLVHGVSAGSATISYTVSNTCGTDIATSAMTVNPLPNAGTVSGASATCVGAATTLASSGTSGGNWSSSNTATATVDPSTGTVTGVSTGTATITYTVTNSCGTANATSSITINDVPSVAAISGPSTVCQYATITLTDATSGGTWSSVTPSVATVSTTGDVTGLLVTGTTIHYAVTNTCGTTTVFKVITVNPLPATPPAITGTTTIAFTGGTTTLSDATGGGSWSSSNPRILTVNSTGLVTALTAGTATITYTVTNSCGSAYVTQNVTCASTNHAPRFVSNNTISVNVCGNVTTFPINASLGFNDADTGQTITISLVTAPTNGSASVSWTGTSNGLTIQPTGLYYYPSLTYVGADSLVAMVSDGISSATTVVHFNVIAVPSTPVITGVTPVCTGGTITLVGTPSGGYFGSMDANTVTNATTGVLRAVSGATSTVYYNGPYSFAGCRSQARATITILGIPTAASISGASTICPGASTTLSATTGGGAWASSNTSLATVTPSGGSVTGAASGSLLISYTLTNICGSAMSTYPMVVTSPTVPAPIGGTPLTCEGGTVTYSNTIPGGTWSLTNTTLATISSTGLVHCLVPGFDTVIYTYTNSCGLTASQSKSFGVYALPHAGTITGPSSMITGTTATFTTTGTGGNWSSSATTIASVTGAGVVRAVSVGIDTIKYKVTSGCGVDIATAVVSVTSSKGENGGITEAGNVDVNIYPNPTTGLVTLELTGVTGSTGVIVTDLAGKVMLTSISETTRLNLDLSNLAAGTYIIKLVNDGNTYTKKVVVE